MDKPSLDEVAEIREIVRAAGLRCTSARLAVMQRLRRATSPMSHAEIADDLASLGLDKATVFRNLVDLSEAGLVHRAELGDHVWRFELRNQDDPEAGQHPHFVCVECGSVTCLSEVEFDSESQRRAAKIGRVTEVLLKGHCRKCD